MYWDKLNGSMGPRTKTKIKQNGANGVRSRTCEQASGHVIVENIWNKESYVWLKAVRFNEK